MSKRKPLTAPWLPSSEYLVTAGRSLAHWWNEAGLHLPGEATAYMSWWAKTRTGIENDWDEPDDVLAQLQVHQQEALLWYERERPYGVSPPPQFVAPSLPGVGPASGFLVWGLVGLGVVLLMSRR